MTKEEYNIWLIEHQRLGNSCRPPKIPGRRERFSPSTRKSSAIFGYVSSGVFECMDCDETRLLQRRPCSDVLALDGL